MFNCVPFNLQEVGLPIKTDEVVLDRVVSVNARNRYEQLRMEAKDLETSIKQLSDALDTLIRIQAKYVSSSELELPLKIARNF